MSGKARCLRGSQSTGLVLMLVASVLCLSAPAADADVSEQGISYQGRLILDGVPVTGTADVVFNLYDQPEGGTLLNNPLVSNIAVAKGLFSTHVNFNPAFFDGQDLWLELAVRSPAGSGSFVTISPRQAVRATGYSHYSTDGGGWVREGNQTTFADPVAQVGIGLTNPASPLHVFRSGFPDASMTIQNGSPGGRRYDLVVSSNTSLIPAGSFRIRDGSSGGERLVIGPSGNVGIGTTNPTTQLHVNGPQNSETRLRVTSVADSPLHDTTLDIICRVDEPVCQIKTLTDSALLLGSNDNSTIVITNDRVGLDVDNPDEKLHVNGNVKANNVMVPSDARLKRDVTTLNDALAVVSRLRGVSYRWKDSSEASGRDDRKHLGFIAQETQAVLPEVVKEGSDGYFTVSYMEIVPVLAEAIKELNKTCEMQRAEAQAAMAESARECAAKEREWAAERERMNGMIEALAARLSAVEARITNGAQAQEQQP